MAVSHVKMYATNTVQTLHNIICYGYNRTAVYNFRCSAFYIVHDVVEVVPPEAVRGFGVMLNNLSTQLSTF